MNKYKIVTFNGFTVDAQIVEASNIESALSSVGLGYNSQVVRVELIMDMDVPG